MQDFSSVVDVSHFAVFGSRISEAVRSGVRVVLDDVVKENRSLIAAVLVAGESVVHSTAPDVDALGLMANFQDVFTSAAADFLSLVKDRCIFELPA
jgi:hypothetical protein